MPWAGRMRQERMEGGNCWKLGAGHRLGRKWLLPQVWPRQVAGVLPSQGGCHRKRKGDFQYPAD